MNHDKSRPEARPGDLESDGTDDAGPAVRGSPVTSNASGRVKFDDRGNAVWEWSVSTGAFDTEVTSSRLRKLENQTLSISEPDRPPSPSASLPPPAGPAPIKENRKGATQGYSPYDSGLLVKARTEVRGKKKDLRRLGEWLKLREQANRNKQGS